MHYFTFHLGDHAKDVRYLSPLEELAYLRLMFAYYGGEKAFSGGKQDISRLIGMRSKAEKQAVSTALDLFFEQTDDGYKSSKLDQNIAEYQSLTAKKSAAGKKGALRKSQARAKQVLSTCQADAKHVPSKCSASAQLTINHKPETKNHKPETKNQKPKTINHETQKDMSAKSDVSAGGKAVREVFNHWKQIMQKGNSAKLNSKRRRAVEARLAEGYSVAQLKDAVLGCSMTPHNCGINDAGKRFDDLELICRSGCHVERFASSATEPIPEVSKVTRLNLIRTQGDW